MTTPLQKIAMIGTGMVAGAHLQSIADLSSKIQLTGVMARRVESAESFAAKAEQHCGNKVVAYTTVSDITNDAEIDWVLVITPPNARMEIVSALAASGKSILLEKPIERNLEAAERLVQVCEQADVSLGIVFQHRMREASMKLTSLVAGNTLGELVIAEVCVPWWREQSYYDEPGRGTYERDGGGVLISQAIHTLDLMLSLTGPVTHVAAMAHTTSLHKMESEDYVSSSMKFSCGAVGSLVASTAHYPGGAESITLHFSRCVAHLQSGVLTLTWRDGREEQFGDTSTTGGGADPMAFTHIWHRSIIEDFSNAVDAGTKPCVSGREALRVHALIDALIASSEEQKIVPVRQFTN